MGAKFASPSRSAATSHKSSLLFVLCLTITFILTSFCQLAQAKRHRFPAPPPATIVQQFGVVVPHLSYATAAASIGQFAVPPPDTFGGGRNDFEPSARRHKGHSRERAKHFRSKVSDKLHEATSKVLHPDWRETGHHSKKKSIFHHHQTNADNWQRQVYAQQAPIYHVPTHQVVVPQQVIPVVVPYHQPAASYFLQPANSNYYSRSYERQKNRPERNKHHFQRKSRRPEEHLPRNEENRRIWVENRREARRPSNGARVEFNRHHHPAEGREHQNEPREEKRFSLEKHLIGEAEKESQKERDKEPDEDAHKQVELTPELFDDNFDEEADDLARRDTPQMDPQSLGGHENNAPEVIPNNEKPHGEDEQKKLPSEQPATPEIHNLDPVETQTVIRPKIEDPLEDTQVEIDLPKELPVPEVETSHVDSPSLVQVEVDDETKEPTLVDERLNSPEPLVEGAEEIREAEEEPQSNESIPTIEPNEEIPETIENSDEPVAEEHVEEEEPQAKEDVEKSAAGEHEKPEEVELNIDDPKTHEPLPEAASVESEDESKQLQDHVIEQNDDEANKKHDDEGDHQLEDIHDDEDNNIIEEHTLPDPAEIKSVEQPLAEPQQKVDEHYVGEPKDHPVKEEVKVEPPANHQEQQQNEASEVHKPELTHEQVVEPFEETNQLPKIEESPAAPEPTEDNSSEEHHKEPSDEKANLPHETSEQVVEPLEETNQLPKIEESSAASEPTEEVVKEQEDVDNSSNGQHKEGSDEEANAPHEENTQKSPQPEHKDNVSEVDVSPNGEKTREDQKKSPNEQPTIPEVNHLEHHVDLPSAEHLEPSKALVEELEKPKEPSDPIKSSDEHLVEAQVEEKENRLEDVLANEDEKHNKPEAEEGEKEVKVNINNPIPQEPLAEPQQKVEEQHVGESKNHPVKEEVKVEPQANHHDNSEQQQNEGSEASQPESTPEQVVEPFEETNQLPKIEESPVASEPAEDNSSKPSDEKVNLPHETFEQGGDPFEETNQLPKIKELPAVLEPKEEEQKKVEEKHDDNSPKKEEVEGEAKLEGETKGDMEKKQPEEEVKAEPSLEEVRPEPPKEDDKPNSNEKEKKSDKSVESDELTSNEIEEFLASLGPDENNIFKRIESDRSDQTPKRSGTASEPSGKHEPKRQEPEENEIPAARRRRLILQNQNRISNKVRVDPKISLVASSKDSAPRKARKGKKQVSSPKKLKRNNGRT